MNDEVRELKGSSKAAVFLLGLGEQSAAEVLRHMGPKEVQKVGAAMASLKDISNRQVQSVVASFTSEANALSSLGVGTEDYVRNVMVQALGEQRAKGVINRVLLGRDSKGIESLKWMEARAVASVIRAEHPQIIAIVLAYLDSDHAAEVLKCLPEKIRADAMLRIARLDTIHPSALTELDDILEKQFSGANNSQVSNVGGAKTAAKILALLDGETESSISESIQAIDKDLGDRIRDLMFVFDNLLALDDRGVQRLLREVSSDILVLALKGADAPMQDKIFNNMSKRAAEMLREDLESRGPVRLSEVETAQKEILAVASRLSEEGEIMLGNKGGEQFV